VEIQPELRRTSDALLEGVDRIRALEREKRTLIPGSPRFREVAEEVEELSRTVLRQSEREEALGRRATALHAQGMGHLADRSIDQIAAPRGREVVFAEWTAAEQRLADMDPGAPEAEEARQRAKRLRQEWAAASAAHRPSED
jgi:hypothetical protein